MAVTNQHDHPDRPPAPDERTKIVFANNDRAREYAEKKIIPKFKEFYNGYRASTQTRDDGSISNLSVPLIPAHIDSFYARLVGMRPKIDVLPREPNDVPRAAKQRLMIDYQWDLMQMLLNSAELAKSALIYGIGWGKCTWKKEVRTRLIREELGASQDAFGINLGPFQGLVDSFFESVGGSRLSESPVTIYNDPFYENISPDQVRADPDGHSIDTCRYLIHRSKMSLDSLEALVKGDGIKINRAAMGRLKKHLGKGSLLSDEGAVTLAEEAADRYGGTGDSSLCPDPTKREFTILEHWTDERVRWAVEGNRDIGLIRDEPHAIGMKPFIRFTPDPLPGELIGTSLTERLYSLWLEMTALTNIRLDNLYKTAHPQVMIPRGSATNPAQIRFQAGGHFFADAMNPPQIFEYPQLKMSHYREMGELWQTSEQIGGTRTFRGQEGSGDTTATEANLLAQASGTKFGAMLQQMNEQPFKRLGRIMVRLNELNVDEDRYARVLGADMAVEAPQAPVEGLSPQIQGIGPGQPPEAAQAPSDPRFEKISPADLASKNGALLDVTIDIATKDPDTQVVKRRQATEAAGAIAQASQFDPALVPLAREAFVELAESYDIHNAQEKIDQGEAALAAQQAQEAEAGAAQGQAGQGSFAAPGQAQTNGDELAAVQGANGIPGQ